MQLKWSKFILSIILSGLLGFTPICIPQTQALQQDCRPASSHLAPCSQAGNMMISKEGATIWKRIEGLRQAEELLDFHMGKTKTNIFRNCILPGIGGEVWFVAEVDDPYDETEIDFFRVTYLFTKLKPGDISPVALIEQHIPFYKDCSLYQVRSDSQGWIPSPGWQEPLRQVLLAQITPSERAAHKSDSVSRLLKRPNLRVEFHADETSERFICYKARPHGSELVAIPTAIVEQKKGEANYKISTAKEKLGNWQSTTQSRILCTIEHTPGAKKKISSCTYRGNLKHYHETAGSSNTTCLCC